MFGIYILRKSGESLKDIYIFTKNIKSMMNYIEITIRVIVIDYLMISRIKAEKYYKSIKIIGLRLSNIFIVDISWFNEQIIGWEKSPILIILLIIIWWIILPCLTIKCWHNLINEFGTNKKINNWCLAYPKWFSTIGLFNITPPIILTMIRKFILIPVVVNLLFDLKIELFYTWHINLVIVMLIYSHLMAWISLSNKRQKYGYYSKYSIFIVGLSGTLLLFALMNKFGLYESYFGNNNPLYVLCTCYFNEFLLLFSRLFNYSIIDKIFSFIKCIFKFTFPVRSSVYIILKNFSGFGLKRINMNVVDNSSNSIGNNNGNGSGNDYTNDKGKGIDYNKSSKIRKFDQIEDVNNNQGSDSSNVKRARLDGVVSDQMTSRGVGDQIVPNDNKTYLWNNKVPFTYPIASTDTTVLGEGFKHLASWGTKSRNGVVCPFYFYDKAEFMPLHIRLIDWQYGQTMKLRQGKYYNISSPDAHHTDEVLRRCLVNGQENSDFIKSTVLDIIPEIADGAIAKVEPQSDKSSWIPGYTYSPLDYICGKYNRNTGKFESKRWVFNAQDPCSVRIYNNFRKIEVIKAEALRGDLTLATDVMRGTEITITKAQYDWITNETQIALRKRNVTEVSLREQIGTSMTLNNIKDFSSYKLAMRASDHCFTELINDLTNAVYTKIQADHPLYDQREKMVKHIRVGLNYCSKIREEELAHFYKVGRSASAASPYYNLKWDTLDCSMDNCNSEIVKMLRERNPEVFKPYSNNQVYKSITWKAE